MSRGRPKSPQRMQHVAVVLPVWLHEKIKLEADRQGTTFGAEVRRLLWASYEEGALK